MRTLAIDIVWQTSGLAAAGGGPRTIVRTAALSGPRRNLVVSAREELAAAGLCRF
jgi:hypothetical protein